MEAELIIAVSSIVLNVISNAIFDTGKLLLKKSEFPLEEAIQDCAVYFAKKDICVDVSRFLAYFDKESGKDSPTGNDYFVISPDLKKKEIFIEDLIENDIIYHMDKVVQEKITREFVEKLIDELTSKLLKNQNSAIVVVFRYIKFMNDYNISHLEDIIGILNKLSVLVNDDKKDIHNQIIVFDDEEILSKWEKICNERVNKIICDDELYIPEAHSPSKWMLKALDKLVRGENSIEVITKRLNNIESILTKIDLNILDDSITRGLKSTINKIPSFTKGSTLFNYIGELKKIDFSKIIRALNDIATAKQLDMKNIIKPIYDIIGEIEKIQKELENVKYNLCFGILGSHGSGKSHWISNFTHLGENLLLIRITKVGDDLEKSILQEICVLTGIQWRTFEQFMKCADEHTLKFANYKYIISIDDFDKLWIHGKRFNTQEVINCMDKYSKYTNIRWIITMNINSYFEIEESKRKLKYYLILDKSINQHDNLFIDKWLVLDDLDCLEEIGFNIISTSEKLLADEIIRCNNILQKSAEDYHINIPLIAQLYIYVFRKSTSFVNYHSGELFGKYIETMSLEDADNYKTRNEVVKLMGQIVKVLLHGVSLEFEESQMFYELKGLSIDKKREFDLNKTKRLFEVLLTNSLLTYKNLDYRDKMGEDYYTPLSIKLNRDRIWAYKFAEEIVQNGIVIKQSILQQYATLFETVGEFIIQQLASKFNEETKGVWSKASELKHLKMINELMEQNIVTYYSLWNSAALTNKYMQEFIFTNFYNKEKVSKQRITLFYFIMFIKKSTADSLSLEKKVKILQDLMQPILKMKFDDIYYYVCQSIINSVSSMDEFFNVILNMKQCEYLKVEEKIAELVFSKMKLLCVNIDNGSEENENISGHHYLNMMPDILNFISNQSIYIEDFDRTCNTIELSQRTRNLREWILNKYCSKLVLQENFNAYKIFCEYNWYTATDNHIHPIIAREMKREANTALGYLFRRIRQDENAKNSYIAALEELFKSKDQKDKTNSFYILYHTTHSRSEPRLIDNALKKLLHEMVHEKKLGKTIHKFGSFIRSNGIRY